MRRALFPVDDLIILVGSVVNNRYVSQIRVCVSHPLEFLKFPFSLHSLFNHESTCLLNYGNMGGEMRGVKEFALTTPTNQALAGG